MSDNVLSIDVNVENEQVVLGALLNDPEAFREFVPEVHPSDFVDEAHATIAETLRDLWKRGVHYAADTVVQLSGERVRGEYLRDLAAGFPALPPENLREHLRLLRRDAVKHSAVEPFAELYDLLDDAHADLPDVERAALQVLQRLRGREGGVSRGRSGEELQEAWFSELGELRAKRAENFVPLHFSGLDAQLYEGLRPGRVVVVAGRPGMGKSTFCSNLTLRLALHGKRVLSVPVEAGAESVVEQMACALARIQAEKVVKAPDSLTDEEMFNLDRASRKILGTGNVVFADDLSTLEDLEVLAEGADFDVVILDLFEYLLPEIDAALVTAALRRVKRLAKRRGFCAVIVQQIKRIERTRNPRPHLHELKNSGGYEEVADLVLLLHRAKYYDPEAEADDVLEINVAKQRRGPQNVVAAFEFEPEICRVGKHTNDYDGEA